MRLENVKRAVEISEKIERIDTRLGTLTDGNYLTKYITFNKGGVNVDLEFSDPSLMRALENTTIDHLQNNRKELLAEIEGL
jgi:hypothetical protein